MTLTTKDVLKMIGKRIAQSIVLANHISNFTEPYESYVNEKTKMWPVLDTDLQDIFHQISIILRSAYGIEIATSPYG